MFSFDSALTNLKLPSNMSKNKIKKMSSVFQSCTSLTSLDLSTLDTSLVDEMQMTFFECNNLASIKGISNFKMSRVTTVFGLFQSCVKLTNLDLSKWNVSSLKDMGSFAYGCTNLKTLNISGWKTSKLVTVYSAFQSCKNITELDVSGLDVSDTETINSVFSDCASLGSLDLSKWNVSQVTSFDGLCQNCSSLSSINVYGWNTTNAKTMSYMFANCSMLQSLNLSSWDINSADTVSESLVYIFNRCDLLTTLNPPKNINASITLPNNLSMASVKNVINNLVNRSSSTSATLKVGTNNMSSLEKDTDTLNIAVSKNWSVVS